MSIRSPQKVVYFSAIMYSADLLDMGDPLDIFTNAFGKVSVISEKFIFNYTQYYAPEMGKELYKFFVGTEVVDSPGLLPVFKHKAIEIENKFSVNNNRTINIDPGYMAVEKVVVASTKNFTHRIYIGDNIYGDLQLMRQKGRLTAMPWTYEDYTRIETINFFDKLFNKFKGYLVRVD